MKFSAENLKAREKFLTPEYFQKLSGELEGADPFTTGTNDLPRAFRVGECREIAPDKAEFQVLLFWRDDSRTEQSEIKATAVKQGDDWLLDGVTR
ncbi:MAG: hypothetical protein ACRD6X_09040 [Pyrinomonadaceae bacterium]